MANLSAFTRFSHWANKVVQEQLVQVISQDRDLEEVMFDSAVVCTSPVCRQD